jgi:hypothetical protein
MTSMSSWVGVRYSNRQHNCLINKAIVTFVWATPRWLHQAVFSRIMNG